MKKMALFICLISMVVLAGCAGPYTPGFIFSNVKIPMCSPDDSSGLQPGSKTGTAEMTNILGWFAFGDASIKAAADNGGIKTVKTADFNYSTILGIINTTTTTVSGD